MCSSDLDDASRAAEYRLVRRMAEESQRPLSLTVLQRVREPDAWRPMMGLLEGMAKDGLTVHAQVIPRPLGTLFGLDMPRQPFAFHPSFKAIAELPLEKKVAAMRDPAFRARLLAEEPDPNDDPFLVRRVLNFDYMFPFGDPPNYAPTADQSIAARARAQEIGRAHV